MNALRSALFALALIVITPPYSLLALATLPLPRHLRYRIISGWSIAVVHLARWICGIRWRVEGLENLPREACVIVSKHQSAWETLAYQLIFPPQVLVLKRELLWIPFFGWGLALMSPIAINRSRGTAALRELARRGRERLHQGFWVVIFPEGTRVAPGTRRRYQPGGAWLAEKAGAPIVPVAHNAGLLWPRNGFLKRPGLVTVRIGAAIRPEGRRPDELTQLAEAWIESQQIELCPDS